jgi:hypothetical protein
VGSKAMPDTLKPIGPTKAPAPLPRHASATVSANSWTARRFLVRQVDGGNLRWAELTLACGDLLTGVKDG